MNRVQLNKLAKYDALTSLLRNAPETVGIAAFPAKMALFEQKLKDIHALAGQQSRRMSVAVSERDTALSNAVLAALTLAGTVLSYAEEKKLPTLANKVRTRPGDFRRVRPHQRVHLAQQIHDAVVPVVPQLADHGVTTATLEELQAKIDAAAMTLSAPRDTTVARKAATEQLIQAFREANAIIENHFDSLLLPLQVSHPEFYRRYKAARILVDRPGSRAASVPVPPAATPGAPSAPAVTPPPLAQAA